MIQEDPKQLIDKIIDIAKNQFGMDECIAIADYSNSVNVRYSLNHIISSGDLSTSTLYIIAIKGKRVSTYSTKHFDENNLVDVVKKACDLSDNTDEVFDYNELVDINEGGENEEFVEIQKTSPQIFEIMSEGVKKVFDWASKKGIVSFGYIENSISTVYLGNSKGLRKCYIYKKSYLSTTIKTQDFKTSLWSGVNGKELKVEHFDQMINDLNEKWLYTSNKIQLPAGKYEVVLTPTAVADMLLFRHELASARSADEGRSMYSAANGKEKVGEKLYPDFISIYSDPFESDISDYPFEICIRSSEQQSVFDNGFPLKKTYWIQNGVLKNLTYTRHWAKKQNIKDFSLFQNTILMEGSDKSINDLVKDVEKGLLLNSMFYIRLVDPKNGLLTGLTRDGVFVIEKGKIVGVCNNFRWNQSADGMLANAIDIGKSDISLSKEWGEYAFFTKTPPLRVKDWNMSTVSEAI